MRKEIKISVKFINNPSFSPIVKDFPHIRIRAKIPCCLKYYSLVLELCLNVVLHSGDWESISHSQLPKGPLASMTRDMNALMLNIKANNALLMKKVFSLFCGSVFKCP